MMWPFSRQPEPLRYKVGYSCEHHHLSLDRNDGICFDCGEPVRQAVLECKWFCDWWHPVAFVRWNAARWESESKT